MVIIPFMLITYTCREKKNLRNLLYGILTVVLFCMSIQIYPSWSDTLLMMFYNSDWLFITVLPFISLYNGERGPATKWSKYFFYIFYPAHLWLITCIAYLVHKQMKNWTMMNWLQQEDWKKKAEDKYGKILLKQDSQLLQPNVKDIEKAQFGYEVSQSAQQLYFRF